MEFRRVLFRSACSLPAMRRATSTAPSCWSMPASPRAEAMTNLLADNRPVIGDTRPSATSLGTREHVNPATGKAQAKASICGPAEIDAAARAAVAGQKAWQQQIGREHV